MIHLILRIEGDPVLREFADETILIGRSPTNHLVLRDLRVSRLHARIERAGGGIRISDLGSGNGTRVNGCRIESSPLGVGDTLEIGPARLIVVQVEAGDVLPSLAPHPTASAVPDGERTTALLRGRKPVRRGKRRLLRI